MQGLDRPDVLPQWLQAQPRERCHGPSSRVEKLGFSHRRRLTPLESAVCAAIAVPAEPAAFCHEPSGRISSALASPCRAGRHGLAGKSSPNGGLHRSSLVDHAGTMVYASSMVFTPRESPAFSHPRRASFALPAPSVKPSVRRTLDGLC